jgi:polyisoprenoid-binding protein YceI
MYMIRTAAILLATILATASATRAQDAYRVTAGKIVVACSLTVGGTFEATTKSLSGELSVPPAAVAAVPDAAVAVQGTLHVDFQTLETGIGLRDRHMRQEYLEVDRGGDFSTTTFSDLRIVKLEGKTTFEGILRLHGQSKHISGTAELQRRDGSVRVQARFPLRISEFQIPSPTYLGVGVRDEVQVSVTLTAVPGTTHFASNASSQ